MKPFTASEAFPSGSGTAVTLRAVSLTELPGSPLLDDVAAFWFSRFHGEGVPDWRSFEPGEHPGLLPHIMLCEVTENSFFVRIAGESVIRHAPVKLSNQFLDDALPPDLSELSDALTRVLADGMPVYAERREAWVRGDEVISYRALHLPFRTLQTHIDRVLSVILFKAEPNIDF